MIIFGHISKYNHIWHTKIQLITLQLHSPLVVITVVCVL